MRNIAKGSAVIAAAASVALTLGGCGGGTTTSTPDTVTSSGAPSTTPSTPAPSGPVGATPATTFGDGNYIVGKDVVAGTYHSEGAALDGVDCYWQRDGANGAPTANHASRDPQTVTINSADTAFHTVGCKTWTKAS